MASSEFKTFVSKFVEVYTEKSGIELADKTSGFHIATSPDKILNGKAKSLYIFQPLDLKAALTNTTEKAVDVCKALSMKETKSNRRLPFVDNVIYYKISDKYIFSVNISDKGNNIELEEHDNDKINKTFYTTEKTENALYHGNVILD